MERGRFLATEYKEQPDQDKGVLSSKSHAEAGDPLIARIGERGRRAAPREITQ